MEKYSMVLAIIPVQIDKPFLNSGSGVFNQSQVCQVWACSGEVLPLLVVRQLPLPNTNK